jgi:hypothetical protein
MVSRKITHYSLFTIQCRLLKLYLVPDQPPTGLIAAVGVNATPSAVENPDGGFVK